MGNLITANLMGGLGNQLFEAAHALAQVSSPSRHVAAAQSASRWFFDPPFPPAADSATGLSDYGSPSPGYR